MKYYLLILAILFSCKNKVEKDLNIKSGKDTIVSIDIDNLKNSIDVSPEESILNKYADSIDRATSLSSLPVFLESADFDDANMAITLNTDGDGQFRSRILNRVTNCSSLKLILSEPSGVFKKRPSLEKFSDTYSDSSNYELARTRLNILNCN